MLETTQITRHPSKLKYYQTGTYYLSTIVLGMISMLKGSTLPSLAENTNSSLSMISVIFTGGSLGYALGSNFGGWLNDRLP
ncbi:MAG: hypothetical protein JW750_12795, partial [Anaerolineaceae bacterium]|nr:hypothetical protein [Anaerolineaceae bacterium]